MSDGGDRDQGRAEQMFSMLRSMHTKWKARGFKLLVVGFGQSGVDVDYLQRMAETAGDEGDFKMCEYAHTLKTEFQKLASGAAARKEMFAMLSTTIAKKISDQIELDFL